MNWIKYIDRIKIIIFFSRTTGPISTKLDTKYPWVKKMHIRGAMGVLFALIVLTCCYRFVSALWLKSHDDDDVLYRVTASYNFLGRDEEASLNMYTTVSCGNDTLSVQWTATKLKNANLHQAQPTMWTIVSVCSELPPNWRMQISLKLSPIC